MFQGVDKCHTCRIVPCVPSTTTPVLLCAIRCASAIYREAHHTRTKGMGYPVRGYCYIDVALLMCAPDPLPFSLLKLKRRGYFPMHAAAGTGAVESMELLISAGLSPRSQDDGGRTPLHHAAAHGSAECVSFLCAFARNTVRTGDRRVGDTPLHFAVRARCANYSTYV